MNYCANDIIINNKIIDLFIQDSKTELNKSSHKKLTFNPLNVQLDNFVISNETISLFTRGSKIVTINISKGICSKMTAYTMHSHIPRK